MKKHDRCPRCDGELRDRIAPKSGTRLRYCPICHAKTKRLAKSAQPDRALAQARAHQAISRALRLGHMTRKPCEEAGCTETKTEAHHHDYSQPLAVEWLCRTHHRRRHPRRKPTSK